MERGFVAFLIGILGYVIYVAGHKLFWFDEFLSFYTENISTAGALLKVQATTPVSLDPPFYHLLGHWTLQLGVNQPFAVRLPSLIGAILMAIGLYLFTRRLAGFYVAAISVAGLVLTYDFYFAEARPYGILLGCSALALLFWQNAIHSCHRRLSLLGLFLVLGLAVSCHYFGILVAVPLLLAETIRTIRRRKLDFPIFAAMLCSYGFAVFWLPYLAGAGQYKAHYYIRPSFLSCIRTYSWLDEINRNAKGLSNGVNIVLFLIIVATVIAGAYLAVRGDDKLRGDHAERSESAHEEWAALVFISLLPLFGGILAVAGAGSFLPRYVIGTSIGLMIPRIAGILTFLRSRYVRTGILIIMAVLIVAAFVRDARHDHKDREMLQLCASRVAPGVLVIPDEYNDFMRLHYYERSQASDDRILWIADMNRELAWEGTDDVSRTMLNLQHFTDVPVASYEELLRSAQKIEIIQTKANRRDWLIRQLQHDSAQFHVVLTKGDHTIYSVQLPNSQGK